jgi:methyl-accepting chemotaxis protein
MKYLNNLFVSTKLVISSGVVCLFMAALGLLAYYSLSNQRTMLQDLNEKRFAIHKNSSEIAASVANVHADIYKLIGRLNAGLEEKDLNTFFIRQKDSLGRSQKLVADILQLPFLQSEEKNLFMAVQQQLDAYQKPVANVLETIEVELNVATTYMITADEAYQALHSSLDKLMKHEEELSNDLGAASQIRFNRSITVFLMLFLCSIACAVGLSLFFGRSILRQLGAEPAELAKTALCLAQGDLEMAGRLHAVRGVGAAMASLVVQMGRRIELAQRIAAGDLICSIDLASDRDRLGLALQTMVERLSHTITEINEASRNVASGAQQLNDTSQAMSQGATEQASSLEEISSSMNEIASQTRQNSENASQASRIAGDTKLSAEKGNRQMQDMVGAMHDINEASRNIARIIKIIDEIAFQTNLLALNAAVEAARAGKYGKGFAVVAEEVRNLAARSAKAAKETEEMIEGSVRKIADGTSIAGKTADALTEIVAGIGKVSDIVAEIAAASSEQAQGVSQMTHALNQVDQVTQQNTAHAEESAASAEELFSQSVVLQELIGTFKIAAVAGMHKTAAVHAVQNSLPQAKANMPGNGKKQHKPGNGSSATVPFWGSGIKVKVMPEPVIMLDDHEFGKY